MSSTGSRLLVDPRARHGDASRIAAVRIGGLTFDSAAGGSDAEKRSLGARADRPRPRARPARGVRDGHGGRQRRHCARLRRGGCRQDGARRCRACRRAAPPGARRDESGRHAAPRADRRLGARAAARSPNEFAAAAAQFPALAQLLPELGNASVVPDRAALFRAAAGAFVAIARHRPLALVLDDLQWADHATLELLPELARDARHAPLLVVAIYRTDGIARGHPVRTLREALRRARILNEILVEPLDRQDALRMMEGLLGREVPADAGAAIVERSAGVPLFVEALAAALQSRSCFDATSMDASALPLPETVRDAILARVDADGGRAWRRGGGSRRGVGISARAARRAQRQRRRHPGAARVRLGRRTRVPRRIQNAAHARGDLRGHPVDASPRAAPARRRDARRSGREHRAGGRALAGFGRARARVRRVARGGEPLATPLRPPGCSAAAAARARSVATGAGDHRTASRTRSTRRLRSARRSVYRSATRVA